MPALLVRLSAAVAPLLAGFALLAGAAAAGAAEEDPHDLSQYLWTARPIVIFADTPNDPRLLRQLRDLEAAREQLDDRDVVVIVDTDPGPSRFETTPLREQFRPHDFNILLIDKDGEIKLRRPSPVTASQLIRMIDRQPLRQQELGRR